MFAACGPVVLDKGSEYFIVTKQYSSNTGEVSAVIEALLYLLACFDGGGILPNDVSCVIHSDSSYVVNLLLGKFTAKENIALVTVHLWHYYRLHCTVVSSLSNFLFWRTRTLQ